VSEAAATAGGAGGLVVGFDLDMTLVDSAAGIAATVGAVLAEVGLDVGYSQVWPLIGVPLEQLLTTLAPGQDADLLAARYRQLYPTVGVPPITLLPGALEALAAIGDTGGSAVVVSTKVEPAIRVVLDHVGLVVGREIAAVAGGVFGAAKGPALRELRAGIFVGDHPGDVAAARSARAWAVAVATGPFPAAALAEADVVLTDLTAFPAWLSRHISRDLHLQHR